MSERMIQDQRPAGQDTMSPGLELATNYYRWITSQFRPYMGSNMLDIGGGNGSHLEQILTFYDGHLTTIDLSLESIELLQQKFSQSDKFSAFQMDFGSVDTEHNPLKDQKFDSVIALDVLEHIEDDLQALQQIRDLLVSGGYILLKVPAIPWLYGSLDEQAGHYRRYTVNSMRNRLKEADFEITGVYYFNGFGVVPWYINSVLLRQNISAGGVSKQIHVFDQFIVPVLAKIETIVPPVLGQSVIAIAHKP